MNIVVLYFPPKRPPIIGTLLNGLPELFPSVVLPPLVEVALVAFVSEVVCATTGTILPMEARLSPEAKTSITAIDVSFFIAIKAL
jgi:hypothetical protein